MATQIDDFKQAVETSIEDKTDITSVLTADLAQRFYDTTDIMLALTGQGSFTTSGDAEPAYYIVDNIGRCAFAINAAGAISVAKFLTGIVSGTAITDGSLNKSKFDTTTLNQLGSDLDERSGFIYAITDTTGRICFGITNKYEIYGRITLTGIADGSIPASKLDPAVSKYLNTGNINDSDFSDTDDDLYHSYEAEVPNQVFSGSLFERFPFIKTRILYGINTSGTSLDFRRRYPLSIKGRAYKSTFNIDNTINENTYIGYVSPIHALPASTSGLTTGNYYRVYGTDGNAFITTGGLSVYRGDLVVFNGTSFVVKAGPYRNATGIKEEFFLITQAGKWEGISYAIGERMILIGINPASSDGKFYFMMKGKAGDNYYMGEFDPVTFSPSAANDGDLYQASATGTYSGLTFAIGDYLIRRGTTWGLIKNSPIQTIANNSYFSFDLNNAADVEVRRTDKLSTTTNIIAYARVNKQQIPYQEDLRIWGDSMSTPFTTHFATYSNRLFTVNNMGGATSQDILSMFKRETLLTNIDDGKTFVFVHGQNDGLDITQLKKCSLEMLNLVGSRNRRYIFVSTLGQRDATWNGSRFVVTAQEGAKTGSNYIAQTEQWYTTLMPKNLFNFRLQMATRAAAVIDPQNPGMTELQVYNTYGILPFSFWFDYAAAGFTPEQLNYTGTWTSATLPAGGSNLDYYIRIAGTTIGNLIVNRSGTWVEYSYDRIHLNNIGRSYYMQLFSQFLTNNNF